MRTLNLVESVLIVLGLILFGIGSQVASINHSLPWLQYVGLGVVFFTGLGDALYRIIAKKSFFK
ncbi:hypothetical protein D1831_02260 [Lactiplantibacillus garii]|uniref:Uncharacterized protein n=1 Tax=Lactiplantibacillus garii TaxID=2306423 RepID=A0A3R8KKD0_9LACO|nr:hypothetical protein [Lactiplantibacillus garii]RRK11534.1 hypothetical protein D1831_02260 [Lactiplantibacillus garii]